MKRFLLLIALAAATGCAESTAPPSPLYASYSLSSVDGKLLPVPITDDGAMLVANTLAFDDHGRPRAGTTVDGLVRYILDVRRPDQSLEHSEIALNYQVRGDELRIDLCPPLALCIAETILVGTITGRTDPLILRHYLGGREQSEYRYFPVLPE
ncbi:MAG TPA: hypothetical protein VF862_11185 [Gemmatimonadales bacterium]